LCETPVALVTVMDDQLQRFLARVGTDLTESPRALSFCTHAMEGEGLMEVEDAALDPRFAGNPLVTGPLSLRFYAGVPLVSAEGVAFGTVCVFDTVPRPGGLTPLQRQGLVVVAGAALARLNRDRGTREESSVELERRHRLEDSERRFRTLADTMPQMVWSTLPDGYHDYYNARWFEFTGTTPGSNDGDGWSDIFHPDDQERAWTRWRQSLATGDPYQIEYRLRHFDGTYRWVLGRALPVRDAATGAITRWFGTCTDIHEQKLASEEREVISQELSHRIKNIFAVIAGLVSFAARAQPELREMADGLRHRITALGRAHDFVRPHSANSRPMAQQDSLHGLFGDLFEPYQGEQARIVVRGDDLLIDDRSATPLALLFHELATNATKYGALSAEGGHVAVEVTQGTPKSRIIWREVGGPPVTSPQSTGFGSQLMEMSAVRQLGGSVTRDWAPDGLVVTVDVPNAAFSRPARDPA
jgi:PAS domain S-box-containing protein